MRKLFLSIALLLTSFQAFASKALTQPMTMSQPDGTQLTVKLHGDEFGSWYTTADGAFLTRVDNAFYISTIGSDGSIVASSILAHEPALRSNIELDAISKQSGIHDMMMTSAENNRRKAMDIFVPEVYFSHTGSPKALVVLAEYEDVPFTLADPVKSFNQYFNETGTLQDFGNKENRNITSMKGYFSKMSGGLYTPEFDVVAKVRVGKMSSYGGNSPSGSDEKQELLLADCMSKLPEGIDYSQYDNDGDGKVDLVYIVCSGYGQEQGGPDQAVWAKSSSSTYTGVKASVRWISIIPELALYEEYWTSRDSAPTINGIGVACHEFSHVLGLPDIYPTSAGAYADNQEMEYWDVMDGGEWIYNGWRPKDYCAWEREIFGWMDTAVLGQDAEVNDLLPLLDGGQAYKFKSGVADNEWFYLENVQAKGWNRSMPGHGLLLYRFFWEGGMVSMTTCPNNVKNKPRVAVVPADGVCISSYFDNQDYRSSHEGDPFPGSSNVTELLPDTNLPNWSSYDGRKLDRALLNISEDADAGTVSFKFVYNYSWYTGISDNMSAPTGNHGYFDLQGRKLDGSANKSGIVINNGRKILF